MCGIDFGKSRKDRVVLLNTDIKPVVVEEWSLGSR